MPKEIIIFTLNILFKTDIYKLHIIIFKFPIVASLYQKLSRHCPLAM